MTGLPTRLRGLATPLRGLTERLPRRSAAPTAESAAPTPPPATGPAGLETTDPVGPADPGFRDRGRLRRRLRYLRRVRELGFRDLGGLVFDLHRFERRGDELVAQKLQALAAVDQELRALERALRDERPYHELREPGLAACPRCAAIHGSDARFCPACGTSLRGPQAIAEIGDSAGGGPAPAPSTPTTPAPADPTVVTPVSAALAVDPQAPADVPVHEQATQAIPVVGPDAAADATSTLEDEQPTTVLPAADPDAAQDDGPAGERS